MMTARDIVTQALRELAVLPSGSVPDAAEMADGVRVLNAMLQGWQTVASLWRNETDTITASADHVDLPTTVRSVTDVRLVGSYERALMRWELGEYRMTPVKAQTGQPIAYAEDRQLSAVRLWLWPVTPVPVTLAYDYQRRVVIGDENAVLDLPEEWEETVWTNLALRLSGGYGEGARLSPELVERAGALLTRLRDDDRPEAYVTRYA